MQAAGKQPEHERLGAGTRLRLLSLTTPAGPVEFGGGLACIGAGAEMRSAIAAAIAEAVIGPRHAEVDGTLEIAGRFVALRSLPSPLLRPSAASTVDRSMLDEFGRRGLAQRRADLEAEHAAHRLALHRTEAAIEQARRHAERLTARMATAVEDAPIEADPEGDVAPDEVTPRLVALLDSLHALRPVPSPDALAVANALEALAASRSTCEPVEVDLATLERRVEEARAAVAQSFGDVSPAARARIEECQRAVVEAERALFVAGREDRPGALFDYQQALGAARAELAQAGVASYTSFLVAVGERPTSENLETRHRAELDLANAEAALDEARLLLEDTREEVPGDEELGLRVRAAQILGHLPGADPVAELRAFRVEDPAAAEIRRELERELEALGVQAGADIGATAQATVDKRLAAPPEEALLSEPPIAIPVVDPALEEEQRVLEDEMQSLLNEHEAHEVALAELQSELNSLGVRASQASEHPHADEITLALTTMLEAYRSADLLAGRLPAVLDGTFDGLGALTARAAANHLAAVDDVQVIVVTGDDDVVDAFSRVDATTSWWPDPDNETPTTCVAHVAATAVARCAHCKRPACLGCLVYMPREAEIWCVGCAEGDPHT